jgi:hypothetical protein
MLSVSSHLQTTTFVAQKVFLLMLLLHGTTFALQLKLAKSVLLLELVTVLLVTLKTDGVHSLSVLRTHCGTLSKLLLEDV